MILISLAWIFLGLIDGFILRHHVKYHNNPSKSLSMQAQISPRRELFFEIVESGLSDRFDPSKIAKVKKFCDYAKGMIPAPQTSHFMHEPCEEYVDGLKAQPWWNAGDFAWSEKLEQFSSTIAAELDDVVKSQEQLFKGDSR